MILWPTTERNIGDYEGLLSSEIKKKNETWSIWKDGYARILSLCFILLRLILI